MEDCQKMTKTTTEPAKRLTPIRAIRAKCLDCSCHQYSEIRDCTVTRCALYPYRLGKRPTATEGHQGGGQ